MRILVVGSGGREHALCWKIAQSPKCDKLYCAPGNGGIQEIAQIADIKADDIDGLLDFTKKEKIDLTVVGPEAPLVAGIVDRFEKEGLRIFGPRKELAALEGSKVFAKELMKALGVPTAEFKVFDKSDDALKYLETKKAPVVVKADGLCAGKGVIVCKTIDEAKDAVKKIMVDRIFGDSGNKVIIEDCLTGEEASIIVISDGINVVALASSQDHKRVFDGDKGPNTGGMGAYSPAPVVRDAISKRVMNEIINPIIKGLAREGKFYKGVLYIGIMITESGPKVLEFNVRFGDPETQAILPRLKGDLVSLMENSIDVGLRDYSLEWDGRFCVSVVIASGGYPGDYEKGIEIKGLDNVKCLKDIIVFHAGTKLGRRSTDKQPLYLTYGGRVLNVTALGDNIEDAIDICYNAVEKIRFDKMHYRKDIGQRAIRGGSYVQT
ncbi:MAG: phosphoribosylamine--glycine ligase [Candidatus Omnitrophica bacterium]|nr:phosphoribosylamine--glycine ligase [Candidatus Omnitrophota bacterium]